jgi:hypothetical protein
MVKGTTKLSMMGFLVVVILPIHRVGFVAHAVGINTDNVGIRAKGCIPDG